MAFPSLPDSLATLDRLAPAVFETAVRSAVILALAGVAALAMRRASAAARHGIWLLAFVGLLLLPVLSATLPGWQVLPRFVATRANAPVIGTGTISIPPEADSGLAPSALPTEQPQAAQTHALPSSPPPLQHAAPAAVQPTAPTAQPSSLLEPASPLHPTKPLSPTTPVPAATHAPQALWSTWPAWVVAVWLTGSLLILSYICLGYLSLYFLQRRCTSLQEGEWTDLLTHLRDRLQIRRPVELLISSLRAMPMTWGLWRTRLLLPEQAATWPAEQRRAVLLHELGHVRRGDCITQLFAQLACALYWFNPLIWVAWHRMQLERERACDDLVLSTGAKASSYAQHLLQSASAGTAPPFAFLTAAVAMARPSTLEERLRAILDARRNRRALSTQASLVMILLLAVALVPVAALRAQGAPASPTFTGSVQLPAGLALVQDAPATPAAPPAIPTPAGGAVDAATPLPPNPTAPPMPTRGGARGGQPVAPNPPIRGGRGGANFPGEFNPPPRSGEGPTCSFDATIYDVRLPVDQLGRIDIDALNKAAETPAAFEKALAALGTSQPLYRAKQSISLANDYINIGTQVPYITNSQITASGQTINSVAYRQTGAIFNISGKIGMPNSIDLNLNVQVSTLSEGNTPITSTVKAPIFRIAQMAQNGTVVPNQPFVIISADASSLDSDGKAMAYIARITLGPPAIQSSAKPNENR